MPEHARVLRTFAGLISLGLWLALLALGPRSAVRADGAQPPKAGEGVPLPVGPAPKVSQPAQVARKAPRSRRELRELARRLHGEGGYVGRLAQGNRKAPVDKRAEGFLKWLRSLFAGRSFGAGAVGVVGTVVLCIVGIAVLLMLAALVYGLLRSSARRAVVAQSSESEALRARARRVDNDAHTPLPPAESTGADRETHADDCEREHARAIVDAARRIVGWVPEGPRYSETERETLERVPAVDPRRVELSEILSESESLRYARTETKAKRRLRVATMGAALARLRALR